MQLRTPVAGRAFAAHSRPNAIDRLAEADAGAAVAQSSGRTSTPNAAPSHRRCRARVRPAAPRHRGSSGEADIQPDRVLDDLGWEAMATVAKRGHADILADSAASRPSFCDNALTTTHRNILLLTRR